MMLNHGAFVSVPVFLVLDATIVAAISLKYILSVQPLDWIRAIWILTNWATSQPVSQAIYSSQYWYMLAIEFCSIYIIKKHSQFL